MDNAFNSLSRKQLAIGIDVGMQGVKVICLKPSGQSREVIYASVWDSPSKDIFPFLASKTKSLITERRLTRPRICLGLSKSMVKSKEIELPRLSSQELEKGIPFQAKKHLQVDPDAVSVDYQPFSVSAENNKTKVILLAADKSLVRECFFSFHRQGLTLSSIGVSQLALINTVCAFYPQPRVKALVDIGHRDTSVFIVNNEGILFYRRLDSGSSQIIDAVASSLQIDREEAQKRICAASRPQEANPAQYVLAELAKDINRSVFYHEEVSPGQKVEKILLSGAAAVFSGLCSAIEEVVGVEAQVLDPFKAYKVSPDLDSSHTAGNVFACALGMVL